MDDIAFDTLTKLLGATPTRRNALGLTAAALGALAGVPWAGALAKRKKSKKKKKCAKKPCPPGFVRNKRTCTCSCPDGMRECRDGCVPGDGCCPGDPPCPTDPKGCCHSPGVDVCTIDGCCAELDGVKACNDFCVDTTIHPSHCGECDTACKSGELCIGGRCEPNRCNDGKPACGDQCCAMGELCCHGICRLGGGDICTADGWCSPVTGHSHACRGTAGCADSPCCNVDIEACCATTLDGTGAVITHCCPGDGSRCAPGGCCPPGMIWGDCGLCCPEESFFCEGCVAPGPGRG